jgi:mannitol-1-/sugar-/sorbitol-6-phosphatase
MTEIRNQTVVIVAGAAGSGKSTVAAVAARALPAALLDIDVTFGPIVPLLAGHARTVVREAIYEGLAETAANAAQAGASVVIAAPFTRERRDPHAWERLRERCAEAGAEAVMAWLRVPDAMLLERLAVRGAGRDAAKLANPAAWLCEATPEVPPTVPHIELDGTRPAGETARALLAALAAREGKARAACSFSA